MSKAPEKAEPSDVQRKVQQLYLLMGAALSRWQSVEEYHYLVFFKMLSIDSEAIASTIYFTPPSFHGRRQLTNEIAHYAIQDAGLLKEWTDIDKKIEKQATKRNEIAHFAIDFEEIEPEKPEDKTTLVLPEPGDPYLRQSAYNLVPGKKKQRAKQLKSKDVKESCDDFSKLSEELRAFVKRIPYRDPSIEPPFLIADDKRDEPARRVLRLFNF